MKTRNKLLTLLILSSGAAAATALINKAIKLSATSRNVLEEPEALCYKWRLGNIHYTKTEQVNRFCWYTTLLLLPVGMNGRIW